MNTKKKYTAATLLIAALLGGCTSMDGAMSSTSDFLDTTGDVLSGDFRGLTAAQRTTMTEMAVDWKQNENNAKKKWDERRWS
jgi:PBP1b-binding outer membrane lipoprotein LpoB